MIIKNIIFTILGFVFLALGVVGVVIPVLPTTPFVIISAGCFSIGNNYIFDLLQRSRFFGPYIENYRTKQGIKKSLKITSIVILWTGLGISMIFMQKIWVFILLGIVGICVTIHLLFIKTKKYDCHYCNNENIID